MFYIVSLRASPLLRWSQPGSRPPNSRTFRLRGISQGRAPLHSLLWRLV
jgi:hypothetical protein